MHRIKNILPKSTIFNFKQNILIFSVYFNRSNISFLTRNHTQQKCIYQHHQQQCLFQAAYNRDRIQLKDLCIGWAPSWLNIWRQILITIRLECITCGMEPLRWVENEFEKFTFLGLSHSMSCHLIFKAVDPKEKTQSALLVIP